MKTQFYKDKHIELHLASNMEVMKNMPDNSVDSIVTDPPYELGFMNKKWDSTGIAYSVEMWEEALRVLKPGGYLIAFSGSRTYHRMAVAIEDAQFIVRDQILWLYGASMPKGLDIRKSMLMHKGYDIKGLTEAELDAIDEPEIQEWKQYNTTLKPAHEPMVLGQKPLEKGLTYAQNILKWGVGGLNIGACRNGGRYPANLVHDGSQVIIDSFPNTKKGGTIRKDYQMNNNVYGDMSMMNAKHTEGFGDSGSAARFFYGSKCSPDDREQGLEDHELHTVYGYEDATYDEDGKKIPVKFQKYGYGNDNGDNFGDRIKKVKRKNIHPTVKPTDLMQYLVRLVTPKNGTTMDIFMGSGSTGKAVMVENIINKSNYKFIGIDMTEEYLPIARDRIVKGSKIFARNLTHGKPKKVKVDPNQIGLDI